LLAGGPYHAFTLQDSQQIEDDFKSLIDLFWANGDGFQWISSAYTGASSCKSATPGMSLSLTLDAMLFNMIGGHLKRFSNARKDIIVAVNKTAYVRIVSGLLLCMVSVTEASEALQAYTYVWGNSTDTDLYVDWDFK
nr:protein kinase superfamily protein [Tanacetum cinerariifolium]